MQSKTTTSNYVTTAYRITKSHLIQYSTPLFQIYNHSHIILHLRNI